MMIPRSLRLLPLLLMGLLLLCLSACGPQAEAPYFGDLTVELGAEALSPSDFFAGGLDPDAAAFADPDAVSTDTVGVYSVDLTYRVSKMTTVTETVTLTVRDTTPPAATFRDFTADVGYRPDGKDFVVTAEDLSPLTYSVKVHDADAFRTAVTVSVADAYGNVTKSEQTLTLNWLKPAFTLELGYPLREPDLLLGVGYGNGAFTADQLNGIGTAVGEFTLTATSGGVTQTVTVSVVDTTAPVLELRNLHRLPGETASVEDFIVSVFDLAAVTTELVTPLTMTAPGTYPVTIAAIDESGNRAEATANLVLSQSSDVTPPVFKGVEALAVVRGSSPNFRTGVSATDKAEGSVRFTVDSSGVNLNKAGTYYVIYTASDSSGNVATVRRKITVSSHTAADTAELVKKMSDEIGYDFNNKKDEVLAIREFVRSIRYNTDWGDPDPTYYGFTTWKGNCKVHATCLKDILDLRGYETNLIWLKEEYTPHYWVQVKLNGKWYHIDATPVGTHNKAPALMNDEERLYYLREKNYTSERLWDTSLWPACP